MGDFANYGGSDEENAEIKRLYAEMEADPDNFECWEKLVVACQALEGGLNRNSNPQALATLRETFDRFLLKFPLLFGYWRKYADLEFTISGPESAEMIYERGCASITNSVDLWQAYCAFKMETTHDPDLVRELFERAASHIGLDFLAHPFWDLYLEYEDRQDAQDKVFAILNRIIHIPMHQYARYYERHRTLAHTRPLSELIPPEAEARYRAEVTAESVQYGVQKAELEIDREIRAKIDAQFYEVFLRTQSEVTKRWAYEQELKQLFFHVTKVDNPQLIAWRKYLDFEETEGDHERIVFLYERCLVTCALYEEFWFRYARWMLAQGSKEEEVRNIYLRATIFVPISRPGIRLQFAYFEEMQGRIDIARDVHAAILEKLPDAAEVIISWANLQRRQCGLDAAIEVYKMQIDSPSVDIFTKAALVAEWAFLLWKIKGSIDEARTVFVNNVQWYADSRQFWQKWLEFELEQPTNAETEAKQGECIRKVVQEMRTKSRLSGPLKQELGQYYLTYLHQRGGKDAMKEFLTADSEMFGPPSVSLIARTAALSKEPGMQARGELDPAARLKAEARFYTYYQVQMEPQVDEKDFAIFD